MEQISEPEAGEDCCGPPSYRQGRSTALTNSQLLWRSTQDLSIRSVNNPVSGPLRLNGSLANPGDDRKDGEEHVGDAWGEVLGEN